MTFQMIHSTDGGNARSPFRIIEQSTGHEVDWINRFLDRECVRPRLVERKPPGVTRAVVVPEARVKDRIAIRIQ